LKLTLRLYPDGELEACADWLKQIQDRLGAWHDEMVLAQRALETFANLPRETHALKVIRRIKEKEISLAEDARDFIISIQATSEYARLRRHLSASLFAMTEPNLTSAQSDERSVTLE
jgi:CHAD domain-containing protein